MNQGHKRNIEDLVDSFEPPVLIISTLVGRGIVSIAEAVAEKLQPHYTVYHCAIEDFLPTAVLNEDVKRYKFISTHFPVLLNIVYRFPLIYYRKYVRDKFSRDIKLITLKEKIESLNIKTIICCSHRPAFWASSLKRKTGMSFTIWGLLSEFGRNLGWKYIFWDYISGYLSPVPRDILDYSFPPACHFFEINLPVRYEYMVLKESRGDHNKVLLVCGFWGQGPIVQIIKSLRKHFSQLEVLVVCGDNKTLFEQVKAAYSGDSKVRVFGAVHSLAPMLSECACLITKPGIATIMEGWESGRKMFLLQGMPVAEDNNARYAVKHFGAEWFSYDAFQKWYQENYR